MYSRIISLLVLFTTFLSGIGSAQIGINTDDPDTSAILDIHSDNKGVLFPQIDNPEKLDKKDGLFYYNKTGL